MVPITSKTGLRVIRVSPTPSMANASPVNAAKSSRRITGSSGALARRMYSTIEARPRSRFASWIAVRKLRDSITIAASSTTIGTHHQRPSS